VIGGEKYFGSQQRKTPLLRDLESTPDPRENAFDKPPWTNPRSSKKDERNCPGVLKDLGRGDQGELKDTAKGLLGKG